MVSVVAGDGLARRILAYVERLRLLGRGAEAEVGLGSFAGLPAVYKVRKPKPYMHPRLAQDLVFKRTRKEAKAISRVRRAGVRVPAVYAVLPDVGVIVLEYVEGRRLRDLFDVDPDEAIRHVATAGRYLALMHKAGVAHGDYTTSNMIVRDGFLYVIDFGLADFTVSIEERATDVHLFRRSLESAHARWARRAYEEFARAYVSELGSEGRRVLDRAEEIRLRGRYVEERRKSVWARVGEA